MGNAIQVFLKGSVVSLFSNFDSPFTLIVNANNFILWLLNYTILNQLYLICHMNDSILSGVHPCEFETLSPEVGFMPSH